MFYQENIFPIWFSLFESAVARQYIDDVTRNKLEINPEKKLHKVIILLLYHYTETKTAKYFIIKIILKYNFVSFVSGQFVHECFSVFWLILRQNKQALDEGNHYFVQHYVSLTNTVIRYVVVYIILGSIFYRNLSHFFPTTFFFLGGGGEGGRA